MSHLWYKDIDLWIRSSVEHLVTNRTFALDLFIPEFINAGSAEVVSTRCGNWAAEHIQTDGTGKVLFRPGSVSRGHPRRQGSCIEIFHYCSNSIRGGRFKLFLKVVLIYSPCCGFCVRRCFPKCFFPPEGENCFYVGCLWFLWSLSFVSWTWRPLLWLLPKHLAPPLPPGSAPTDTRLTVVSTFTLWLRVHSCVVIQIRWFVFETPYMTKHRPRAGEKLETFCDLMGIFYCNWD